jgi:hypothetical protein
LAGTDYEDMPPPKTEDLVAVFAHLYDRCMERRLPVGVAPNIHVSLVLLPEECGWLSSRRRRHWSHRLKLELARRVYRRRLHSTLARTAPARTVRVSREPLA